MNDLKLVSYPFWASILLSIMFGACTDSSNSSTMMEETIRDMEMAGMETAGAETAGMETAGMETAGMETAGMETAGMETAGMETAGMETAGMETAGMETAGIETAGMETAGMEMAGMETMLVACEEQMACLLLCEIGDFACRQSCVLEARVIDQDTLETAKDCIDRSMCTDQTCALSTCLSPLTACAHPQGINACEQSQSCLTQAEQPASALACVYQADMTAETQVTTWLSCLATQNCTELNCEACPLAQLCGAGISYDNTSCPDVLNCVAECNGEQNCMLSCTDRSAPEAVALLNALLNCMQVNMCGSDQSCIMNSCGTELLACATDPGVMPVPMIDTCMDLNQCLEDCGDNLACKNNCIEQTPQDALDLFNSLKACSDMNMCNQDVSCLSSNCQQELVACVSDM